MLLIKAPAALFYLQLSNTLQTLHQQRDPIIDSTGAADTVFLSPIGVGNRRLEFLFRGDGIVLLRSTDGFSSPSRWLLNISFVWYLLTVQRCYRVIERRSFYPCFTPSVLEALQQNVGT